MAKEKNYNPVQAQRKADKAKAIKKGKADNQARRNEKLSKRNPERIQQQINDLKALKEGGGKLTSVEEQSLEALEKDLKAVKKAREALGDNAPTFGRGAPRHGDDSGVLGKRRRDFDDASSDSDVPEDVKKIPMPRDTPPPIPKEVLDEWWAKRRAKRSAHQSSNQNANQEPLGEGRGRHAAPATPPVEAKTVYEAKPVIRNLQKEAVSAFVPTVVRTKIDKGRGKGGLLEPEEADQLEKEGYFNTVGVVGNAAGEEKTEEPGKGPRAVMIEDVEDQG